MFRKMFEEHWQRQKRWDKYLGDGELVLRFAICIWVGFIFACVWVWPTNTFFFNSGLYADSDGRIYIGEKSWIGVYENGKLVDKLAPASCDDYYEFTIVEEQIHMWGMSDSHRVLDMDGNRLHVNCEIHDKDGLSIQEKHEFKTEDGRFYKLENGLLKRAKVTCYHPDGREEVVFQMPLGLYVTKLAFFVYAAGLLILGGKTLVRNRRREAENYKDLQKY